MSDPPESDIEPGREDATLLLKRIGGGDEAAVDALLPLVYDHLRAVAQKYFRAQPADHTLQPTALVHEAYLKLIRSPEANWKDRAHFFAVAATAMRQILTDHARGKARQKRGAGAERVTLSNIQSPSGVEILDLLDLERALRKLGEESPRQARLIELWFFGGLKVKEIAGILGVTERTVRRDWSYARAWLNRELDDTPGPS